MMAKKNNDTKTTPTECHWGNLEVFSTEYSVYYGGGKTRGAKTGEVDVIIDLAPRTYGTGTGYATTSPLYSKLLTLKGVDEFLQRVVDKEKDYKKDQITFELDWDDLGVPPFTKKFFEEFAAALEDGSRAFLESRKTKRKILVMCAGGHGRTGTMIAILALINGALAGDKKVLENIRDMYCPNCVEAFCQAELIGLFCKESFQFTLPPKKAALIDAHYGFEDSSTGEYRFPSKKGGIKDEPAAKKAISCGKEDTFVGVTMNDPEFDYEYDCQDCKWHRRK